jgi:hypothetical protein
LSICRPSQNYRREPTRISNPLLLCPLQIRNLCVALPGCNRQKERYRAQPTERQLATAGLAKIRGCEDLVGIRARCIAMEYQRKKTGSTKSSGIERIETAIGWKIPIRRPTFRRARRSMMLSNGRSRSCRARRRSSRPAVDAAQRTAMATGPLSSEDCPNSSLGPQSCCSTPI